MKKRFDYTQRIDELLKRKNFLINELERIRLIEGNLDSELWKYVNDKGMEEYNEIESKLFQFDKATDKEILILLATRRQIIKFLSIKDYVKAKDNFNAELQEVNGKIREYKSKQ